MGSELIEFRLRFFMDGFLQIVNVSVNRYSDFEWCELRRFVMNGAPEYKLLGMVVHDDKECCDRWRGSWRGSKLWLVEDCRDSSRSGQFKAKGGDL
jgi:hypothetical protein